MNKSYNGQKCFNETVPISINMNKLWISFWEFYNLPIKRLVAPFVSSTVHQPCDIQNNGIPKHGAHKPSCPQTFTPKVPWNNCWYKEAHNRHQYQIVFLLETQYRVRLQVRQINLFTLGNDVGMFTTQQPTDMWKEEATCCIVRISVCLWVFVVHSMITSPIHSRVLERNRIKHCQ